MKMTNFLPLVEQFHSLQGEGYHAGKSAFFVRLAGCKVGCSWCDTKNSWDEKKHPSISIEKIIDRIKIARKKGASFCVITCLLYTSPSPRDKRQSRMPSSA